MTTKNLNLDLTNLQAKVAHLRAAISAAGGTEGFLYDLEAAHGPARTATIKGYMRDLDLQARAHSVREIDDRMLEAQKRKPYVYGNSAQRIGIKLALQAVGLLKAA